MQKTDPCGTPLALSYSDVTTCALTACAVGALVVGSKFVLVPKRVGGHTAPPGVPKLHTSPLCAYTGVVPLTHRPEEDCLIHPPHIALPPDLPVQRNFTGQAQTMTTFDGLAVLHLDPDEFDFHIDASPHCCPITLKSLIAGAARRGYEPIPEEEDIPETLDNGWTRIYLTPIEPVVDTGNSFFDNFTVGPSTDEMRQVMA